MQLEAYRRAETIINPLGQELPMPHIDRLCVLWTPYDGPWEVMPVLAT